MLSNIERDGSVAPLSARRRQYEDRSEDGAAREVAKTHRHLHGVAAGFAKSHRQDLDDPEQQRDFRNLAEAVCREMTPRLPFNCSRTRYIRAGAHTRRARGEGLLASMASSSSLAFGSLSGQCHGMSEWHPRGYPPNTRVIMASISSTVISPSRLLSAPHAGSPASAKR